jgi:hypothetical protein
VKDVLGIKDFMKSLKKGRLNSWFDKLTFPHILLIWVLLVVGFGAVYAFLSGDTSRLIFSVGKTPVTRLSDTIYFSFVAATTTGFGDIVPVGLFRIVAIFEVIIGLLLLAIVTSKLVSIKQNLILSEVYDLSFHEKINRLRSTMLLFRQNLGRVIGRVEEESVRKREIQEVYIYISSLEDVLTETIALYSKSNHGEFKKEIDAVTTELIFHSVISSFEKLSEFIAIMGQHKLEWKREITVSLISSCISLNEELFAKISDHGSIIEKTVKDLKGRNSAIIAMITSAL